MSNLMSGSSLHKSYCTFCRLELHSDSDIQTGSHQSCSREVEAYRTSESMFLSQLINFFPNHDLKIYLNANFPFFNAKQFTYRKLEQLQQQLNIYQTQFTSQSEFILLIIHNNQIVALHINDTVIFPQFILTIPSLAYLSINFSESSELCYELQLDSLPNLAGLNLSSNSSNPFPILRNVSGQSQLRYLAFKHFGPNWITTLPDGIESISSLEILVLELPLKEYPTSLCYLPKLEILKIYSSKENWTIVFPNTIVNLRQLHAMQIEAVTPEFNKDNLILQTLNSIELRNVTVENKLLPLDTLLISGFYLGYDELFPVLDFKKLNQLFLIDNHISDISEELLIFVNLVYLDLSFNIIETIPDIFRYAKNLREIYITDNLLTNIDNLLLIRHISMIDAQNNNITTLPVKIINNRKNQFELLDLRGNKIESVPQLPFVKI